MPISSTIGLVRNCEAHHLIVFCVRDLWLLCHFFKSPREGGPGLHELQQNAQYLVLLSIQLSEAWVVKRTKRFHDHTTTTTRGESSLRRKYSADRASVWWSVPVRHWDRSSRTTRTSDAYSPALRSGYETTISQVDWGATAPLYWCALTATAGSIRSGKKADKVRGDGWKSRRMLELLFSPLIDYRDE